MAYVNGHVARQTDAAPCDTVYCDECAEGGRVPFHLDTAGLPMQARPWCWWRKFGGPCDACGAEC